VLTKEDLEAALDYISENFRIDETDLLCCGGECVVSVNKGE
jgi:L-lysine 2,3-aminomutase